MTQDINTHFVELLKASVLPLETKTQIVDDIRAGRITEGQVGQLYDYLVTEEKVRVEKAPELKDKMIEMEEELIEKGMEDYIQARSKENKK
ncbi:hypothetical protein HOG48_01870 [Candidatus Peregrinibacteria bacterium]|jgi:hypothetical protein|nr:hypothetical protein [Candidatus Peregrinibacteria bacterium]